MVALFVQTLLLMGAAYFIGAALGCLVRRAFFSAETESAVATSAERRVDPLPEVAAGAARFARSGESEVRIVPPPTAQPVPQPAPAVPVPPAMRPALAQPQPVAPPLPAPPAASAEAQDLRCIRLIDAGLEAALGKLGVRRYEQIAAWKQADVQRINDGLGLKGRISQENWIEQAQVLAKGGETHFSARRARGEAANAEPTPDEGERRPMAASVGVAPRASTGGAAGVAVEVAMATMAAAAAPQAARAAPYTEPKVSERAAFAASAPLAASPTAPTVPAAIPIRPVSPPTRDDLLRISGIDGEIEKLLAAHGVTRYSQIAHWSPADVSRFEGLVGTPGRIGRENWIEQGQILSRGGDTKFSLNYDRAARGEAAPVEGQAAPSARPVKLADAIQEQATRAASEPGRPLRTDMGSLRSVKSEIYQSAEGGGEAAQRGGLGNRVLRSAVLDDLKRIRGIGVLIEKKLNSMGVVAYEQIANWTNEDIDRVSQSLDFKGRIERENWVEQARILASGGATEFSRRVDRGEVETSRYKQ